MLLNLRYTEVRRSIKGCSLMYEIVCFLSYILFELEAFKLGSQIILLDLCKCVTKFFISISEEDSMMKEVI